MRLKTGIGWEDDAKINLLGTLIFSLLAFDVQILFQWKTDQ